MKRLLLILPLFLFGCRGCFSSFSERKASVLILCPTCTFVYSEGYYFATDTSKRPNITYKVVFKDGGMYYKASDVDHLIRIN